ncbi:MAG: SDR family NAD(P)-dependent oxidoreductase, partial [Sneathiella sp.]
MNLNTVLITGANRGIGFQLCKLYGQSGDWNVIATCRTPDTSQNLQSFSDEMQGRVTIKKLDVGSGDSVSSFAAELENKTIDLLINNAGIMGGSRQSMMDMDFDQWAETLNINTMGPLRMVQACLSNLKQSAHPKIVTISSQMGSMSRLGQGS